ncbi:MarR family transcriptional regulator [Nocardioides guangzhouensis]|uniref:MarR family transcriptional regulator n=1 Tax=Nocardioides guangzhouensis TaxID=2497878 RepID=A0A4V1Y018_9ACTN|nr:MarR family transcriptional regulator [Nocardioides guangzhouensis]RYP88699.1 MarR family transcriptional regulator [Nocardioides guangzhouensis]
MTSRHDGHPDHILALLGYLMDAFRRELPLRLELVDLEGAPGVTRSLRGSQIRLLSLTPEEGLRVTDLADRAGMTKQSLGEFATTLEAQGLLESVRDPADRRVRILRPTADGMAAVRIGQRVIEDLEQEYRQQYGAERWDTLREILLAITSSSEGTPTS